MPDSVIVSIPRSPIGRALGGSLKDIRPDDLTRQTNSAALRKTPELDVADIEDLVLNSDRRVGETRLNIGHVMAMLAGRHLPRDMRHCLCTEGLTKQYWPERLEVMDSLPSTPSGKIQKFELRRTVGGTS